jgi:hypothetical protein
MMKLFEEVGEGGLRVRTGIRKNDEFQELFQSFASMVEALRAQRAAEIAQLEASLVLLQSSNATDEQVSPAAIDRLEGRLASPERAAQDLGVSSRGPRCVLRRRRGRGTRRPRCPARSEDDSNRLCAPAERAIRRASPGTRIAVRLRDCTSSYGEPSLNVPSKRWPPASKP